jgi:hypothetical protein
MKVLLFELRALCSSWLVKKTTKRTNRGAEKKLLHHEPFDAVL